MLREGLLQYWWMLYRHCKLLDQRTDVFRNIEDSYAAKQADALLSPGKVHLDIGSGSSPIPSFLYMRRGATTFATEMDPTYLKRQRSYAATLGLSKGDSFHVQTEDATRLSFRDGAVDFVTAVSTIEHIPGNGDTRAMAEFARVLRPGGRAVITIPFSAVYTENESTFYYSGFERRYDEATLQSRLFHPDLRLIDQLHMTPPQDTLDLVMLQFGEIFEGKNWVEAWYQNQWHDKYPDVSIVLSLGVIRLSKDPAGSFGAMLTFEKQ